MNRHGEPTQLADDDEMRGWLNAALAGEPPVRDAVPGVRAAIRRRRHRMATSVGVAVVAVAGLAIAGLQLPGVNERLETVPPATSSPAPSVRPSPSLPPPASSPAPTQTASPSPRRSASPSGARVAVPHLTVSITTTSARGASDVTWSVRIRGLVPQLYDAQTGIPIAGADQLLGTTESFGDGSHGGSDGGAVLCHRGAPLVPVDVTFRLAQHTYTKPGDYTYTFGARACVLGTVTQTVRVHVTGPAQQLSLALPSVPLAATGPPVSRQR